MTTSRLEYKYCLLRGTISKSSWHAFFFLHLGKIYEMIIREGMPPFSLQSSQGTSAITLNEVQTSCPTTLVYIKT